MKRADLVRHLEQHGCEFLREGGRHSVYVNRTTRKSSTVPRHREINDNSPARSAGTSRFHNRNAEHDASADALARAAEPQAVRRVSVTKVVEALARYVDVLTRCAQKTTVADDRRTYQQHLAAAAAMLAGIREDPSLDKLRGQVAEERRAYGWGYLVGDTGAEAEKAFQSLLQASSPPNKALQRTSPASPEPPLSFKTFGDEGDP